MGEGEEWVLRPCRAGMCRYESLVDGTLGLEDVSIMNEYLDVEQTNEILYREANE